MQICAPQRLRPLGDVDHRTSVNGEACIILNHLFPEKVTGTYTWKKDAFFFTAVVYTVFKENYAAHGINNYSCIILLEYGVDDGSEK